MNLTIFSGTFNPIHTGHLIIAESVKNELNLNKLLFIPSYQPPHRDDCFIKPIDRYKMVELATNNNLAFEVSNIELCRQNKSYSVDTVKQLLQENKSYEKINFVIGTDAFKFIDSWHNIHELVNYVNFIIISRPDFPEVDNVLNQVKLKNYSYKIVKAPLIDISSSFIREQIQKNKSIKYLVPEEVEAYIIKNNLYK